MKKFVSIFCLMLPLTLFAKPPTDYKSLGKKCYKHQGKLEALSKKQTETLCKNRLGTSAKHMLLAGNMLNQRKLELTKLFLSGARANLIAATRMNCQPLEIIENELNEITQISTQIKVDQD